MYVHRVYEYMCDAVGLYPTPTTNVHNLRTVCTSNISPVAQQYNDDHTCVV